MADVAEELARRGHRVEVLASNRGYDDPTIEFQRREMRNGVRVLRLPFTSLGKTTVGLRVLGALAYTILTAFVGARRRDIDAVLATSVPPMGGLGAVFIGWATGARLTYWVMDVHPDQSIALGLMRPNSLSARIMDRVNRVVISRSAAVVTLDRFMSGRIEAKHQVSDKLHIVPAWSPIEPLEAPEREPNRLRERQGLGGKRVIMYSGNHSLANPLTTILKAAASASDSTNLTFLFAGGGVRKAEVEDFTSDTIRSLPYVPMEHLEDSLSAADVHIVSVGDQAVGVVHPSKVYGAMAVGRPILLLGPGQCHVADILSECGSGWRVDHGDLQGADDVLESIASITAGELAALGRRARTLYMNRYSRGESIGRICSLLVDSSTAENSTLTQRV
jgi:hypothetical protein